MSTPEDVSTIARSYVGSPFYTDGRIKGKAIDCLGIVVCVAWDLGWKGPACTEFRLKPAKQALEEAERVFQLVPLKEPVAGALLVIQLGSKRRSVDHFALLTTSNTIIHAHDGLGKVVEHTFDDSWRARVIFVWALPTVSY